MDRNLFPFYPFFSSSDSNKAPGGFPAPRFSRYLRSETDENVKAPRWLEFEWCARKIILYEDNRKYTSVSPHVYMARELEYRGLRSCLLSRLHLAVTGRTGFGACDRTFDATRQGLLSAQVRYDAGAPFDFPQETAHIRAEPFWHCASPSPGLEDRCVDITGHGQPSSL
ncbi:hypothetical protein BC826DRAFT_563374 [Russula brevipes]|nr:hypothetical protein BC826DRAFT_563374 [Russula brevipes]